MDHRATKNRESTLFRFLGANRSRIGAINLVVSPKDAQISSSVQRDRRSYACGPTRELHRPRIELARVR